MSKIVITEAPLTKLPALNRLFVRAVDQHFTYFPEDIRRRVKADHSLARLLVASISPRRVVLTAKSGNKLVGYAIGAAPKTGPATLFWLYVEPEHRGSNTGLSLLSRMLKVLGERGAKIVTIATHDHRRYYERQGFKFQKRSKVDGVPMDILSFKL